MSLGLVLSGGGVKGAAHIGVLKALEEGIKFDFISGTSSGSIVATLYASGNSPEEIYNIFKNYCKEIKYFDFKNIFNIIKNLIKNKTLLIEGFNSGEKIEKLINKYCEKNKIKNINQIKNNLIIPAVDVYNGNIYYFCSNSMCKIKNKNNNPKIINNIQYIYDIDIGKAVRASCSYPGVFVPTEFNNTKLIDGGIRENTPWRELKECGADKVICVCFETEKREEKDSKSIIDVIMASIEIMGNELANYELEGIDFLLKIKSKKISLLDSSQIDYLYKLGYEEAKKQIKKLNYGKNKLRN
jgi:NTE family protein